jgi:acyl carrier protein
MDSNVQQIVVKAIADVLEKKDMEVPLNASLEHDLQMDSLKRMTLFILLEDEFHRTMEPEEVIGIVTVQNIIDFISQKLKESKPT